MALRDDVLNDRLKAYADLRGGYSFPLAGAIYWFALAGLEMPVHRSAAGSSVPPMAAA